MEIDFEIAENWNKLNFYQAKEILYLIHNTIKIDDKTRQKLLSILFVDENPLNETYSSNLKCQKYAKLLRQTTPAEIEKQFHPLDFIFSELTWTKFPEFVEINNIKYFGPSNRLANLTIEEFSFCDHLFFDWQTKKNPQYLDILITALYRPLSTTNTIDDKREAFSRHNLSLRSSILPLLDEKTKLIIGYAFQGSRSIIIDRFPILFPKQKFKKSKPKVIKYKPFTAMINTMVLGENQPLGSLHEIKLTNVNEFFEIVEETIIANRKRQEALKKK